MKINLPSAPLSKEVSCFGKIGVKQEETFVSRNSNVTHAYSEEKFHNNIRTTTLDWSRGTEVPEGNSPGKHFPQ